ncbi:hypothetical protein M0802_007539 [Mischocyttarus mexicanus]|nr:hypothetical protein M0802_007539 [Mischocyttarus mexicanus]
MGLRLGFARALAAAAATAAAVAAEAEPKAEAEAVAVGIVIPSTAFLYFPSGWMRVGGGRGAIFTAAATVTVRGLGVGIGIGGEGKGGGLDISGDLIVPKVIETPANLWIRTLLVVDWKSEIGVRRTVASGNGKLPYQSDLATPIKSLSDRRIGGGLANKTRSDAQRKRRSLWVDCTNGGWGRLVGWKGGGGGKKGKVVRRDCRIGKEQERGQHANLWHPGAPLRIFIRGEFNLNLDSPRSS